MGKHPKTPEAVLNMFREEIDFKGRPKKQFEDLLALTQGVVSTMDAKHKQDPALPEMLGEMLRTQRERVKQETYTALTADDVQAQLIGKFTRGIVIRNADSEPQKKRGKS